MHGLKQSLIVSLVLSCSVVVFGQNQVSSCLDKGKKEFAARQYASAKGTFLQCLELDKDNEEVLLSLGGVALTQEELDEAKSYFLAALKKMKRTSPYLSYTYSMLGDIALKQQNNKAALAYYNKSLSYNEAYVNSLVGKGVITEANGDKKSAADIYQTALSVEPLNLIARKRLIALEPIYFSDEDILEALKQRGAVQPDQNTLSAEEKELFFRIHSAEQHGGLDYLKEKFIPLPTDYTLTLFPGTNFSREELTFTGYNALQKNIAQDAIAVFQKAGVRIQDVFALRDQKGNKIFLADSTLTDSGMSVYQEALRGHKTYLLPTEELPPTPEYLEQISKRVKELDLHGYTEISRKEVEMIKAQTNCSEETMRRQMGLYVLPISRSSKRYFVLSRETNNALKGAPWYYVAKSRARTNPSIVVPENSLAKQRAWMNFKICSSVDGEVLE